MTPFGMTQDDKFATKFLEHRRADFACEGAVRRPMAILRGELDFALVQNFADRRQGCEGRCNNNLAEWRMLFSLFDNLASQVDATVLTAVHLPVPDDQRLSHISCSKALIPGSCLPSRNSRVAPPPVDR